MTDTTPGLSGPCLTRPKSAEPWTVGFAEAAGIWTKIGFLSFGGPAGQIALMHRLVVEEKRWIEDDRFLHALNYCMLLPGPEAQQLAIYLGWLLHRTWGGIVAGILFILPGALLILGLSFLYVTFQDATLIQGMFFGIKASVLAVVVHALLKIARKILKGIAAPAIAALAFLATFALDLPFPLIVVAAGVAGMMMLKEDRQPDAATSPVQQAEKRNSGRGRWHVLTTLAICLPLWLTPVVAAYAWLGVGNVYFQEGLFFSKMSLVTFGGAYAVLAYLAQQAVSHYGWLNAGEMLDGLGLAETTPGPLIMVVQFVGFLGAYRNPGMLDPYLAGTLGAVLTTWVTFVPCFLWIFLGAPYVEGLRGNKRLRAALSGITAAIVGVVLNLTAWFGLRVIFTDMHSVETDWITLDLPVVASTDMVALGIFVLAFLTLRSARFGIITVLALSTALGVTATMLKG